MADSDTRGGGDATFLHKDALVNWHWLEATGNEGARWTTTTDRVVIDHILVSPKLAAQVMRLRAIDYFDLDSRVPNFAAETAFPGILKNLTDHRPVTLKLRLGT